MTWFDLDADGDKDALALRTDGSIQLLRNEGSERFVEVPRAFDSVDLPVGAVIRDVLSGDGDGDGLSDVLLFGEFGVRFLRQEGGGLVDATRLVGLEEVGPVGSASWTDADGDARGDLHLVVAGLHRVFVQDDSIGFRELEVPVRSILGADASQPAIPPQSGAGVSDVAEPTPSRGDRAMPGDAGVRGRQAIGLGPDWNPATAAAGTGATAPGPGAMDILDCVRGLADQGGGECIRASSEPTYGMVYPLGYDLAVYPGTERVGIRAVNPEARLEVSGVDGDSAAIQADLFSSVSDVSAVSGVISTTSSEVFGLRGEAIGGSLSSRGVLGVIDRSKAPTNGSAAVEGRFLQRPSGWGSFYTGVEGSCNGAYGVHGIGEEHQSSSDTFAGVGVLGEGSGVSSGTFGHVATGVWGISHGDGGYGVRGEGKAPGAIGVLGSTDQADGLAGRFEGPVEVQLDGTEPAGLTVDVSDPSSALVGTSSRNAGANGIALFGEASHPTGTTYGVFSLCASPNGVAGRFQNTAGGTAGDFIGEVRVDGKVSSNGSSGGVFSAANPNAQGATASLGWLNDVARIRVGGSGTGAQNGFDIQTTGDASLLRILHNGRVGVGTASPSAKLDVFGESSADVFRVRVDGTTRLVLDGNGTLGVGANFTPSYDLQVSSSAPNGGTAAKPGGGSWSSSSDRRLKKNIEDLDGALETLLALRGVTFEYKDPEAIDELAGTRIGFIAQEVEDVLPDWVSEKPDGMKMVTVRGFEALAVEALREQQATIDSLRVELARQAAENGALRSELQALALRVDGLARPEGMRR